MLNNISNRESTELSQCCVGVLRLRLHFIISLRIPCKIHLIIRSIGQSLRFDPYLHHFKLRLFTSGTRGFKSCGRGSGSAGTSPTLSPKKTFLPSSQTQLPPSSIALSVTSHYVSPQVRATFFLLMNGTICNVRKITCTAFIRSSRYEILPGFGSS